MARKSESEDGAGRRWLERRTNRQRTHFSRRPSLSERRREQLVRDWYGGEIARLEILAHQPAARPVSSVLGGVFAKIGKKDVLLLGELCSGWPDLVGPDVAANTRPVAVRGDVLTIEVASASWLYVLQHERNDQIAEKVQAFTSGRITLVRMLPQGTYRPG